MIIFIQMEYRAFLMSSAKNWSFRRNYIYLISYDREKSENEITVYLDNEVSGARDEDKLLKPMLTILSHVPIRETVSIWTEKEYGILYYGMRKWGDNSEGIIFMDDQGGTRAADRSHKRRSVSWSGRRCGRHHIY